jgi:hypothetical protein
MANEFEAGYALTIGIGAYKHLAPLTKSPTDAQDIADLLVQQCGYPPAQVTAMTDTTATKAAINAKLEWLARRATQNDTVVIFFSGHGAQRLGGFDPGEYLCPVEADSYNLRASAISSDEFSTALRALKAKKVVVFFDACHSGGVGDIREAEYQMKAGLSPQQYERLAAGEGRVIVASCKPDEVSWELKGMRNGLFTHYLLEGLRGAAARSKGEISIFGLFDYTEDKVRAHAQEIGIIQTPWCKAETENFVVAIKAQETPPPVPPSPITEDLTTKDDSGMNECESLKQQLAMARRSLNILEGQAAGYTVLTIPAHLQIEVEEQRRKVEGLGQRFQGCLTKEKKMNFDELFDCVIAMTDDEFREMVTRFTARSLRFPDGVDRIKFMDYMRIYRKLDDLESYLRDKISRCFSN